MHIATMLTITSGLLIAGCANPINQKTASNYYDWAVRAELAGDFELAERNYERALINARLGHSPDAGVSAAMYGLGRVKGYRCKLDEAEKLLLESLQLEEKVTGPESDLTTKRLFELARLYYDQGKFEMSLPYFSRALPAVKKLGIEKTDPIALAYAFDEYASALSRSGRDADAALARSEANQLRARNPGAKAVFVPIRYKCSVRPNTAFNLDARVLGRPAVASPARRLT